MLPFFKRRQPGVWISAGAHLALLVAAVVSLPSEKLPDSDEGIPVEVLTENQFSQITKGEIRAAKPMPDPKPRAERQADTSVDRDPGEAKRDAPAPPKRPVDMKLADQEVEAASAPPPPPPQRVAEVKPETPPARPDTAKAEAAKAEAAKADATKVEAAKAEAAKETAKEAAKEAAKTAKAEAARAEAEKLAEQREAEAIEQAKVETARKSAALKADAAAKAETAAKAADAKAAEAKKLADAKAKADAEAKMKVLAEAAAKQEAQEKAEKAEKLAEAKAEKLAEKLADEKAKAEAAAKTKAVALAKAKAEEAKARRQAELAEKFSAGDIRQLLASKEPSQSTGATAREVNRTASLGTSTGSSPHLNPSQRDQIMGVIREQLIRCWQPPIALQNAQNPPVPRIRIQLKEDGTLRAEPAVENASADSLFRTVADSAMRATRRCAPLRIPAQFAPYYQDWKDLVVGFYSDSMG